MNSSQSAHLARVRHLRESFASANERLVARLRAAADDAAERHVPGCWSAAQIGWHVATVTTRFAGLIAGDLNGPQPLPDSFRERPWEEIAAAIPERLQASGAVTPPSTVRRSEAVAALEAAATRMARAFDALTDERGSRTGITHPIVGTISLYQLGEWATAHIARHNRQAKRVLGQ
jgi:pyruvate/2-oxoglutarate dehydrogenase complex dihydrolipoamide acyltransferase (E2) component